MERGVVCGLSERVAELLVCSPRPLHFPMVAISLTIESERAPVNSASR